MRRGTNSHVTEGAQLSVRAWDPKGIRRDSAVPLHFQLRHLLLDMIERGEFRPQRAIPTERALAARYGVSLAPIRQAMLDLVREGLLYRVPGQGTFLREQSAVERVEVLSSFSESMRAKGFDVSIQILRQDTANTSAELRESLATNEGRVLRFERLAVVDGEPLSLLTSFLSMQTFPGLRIGDRHGGSLYRALEDDFGVVPARAEMVVGVVPCSTRQSALLGLMAGSACLFTEGTSYDRRDVPVESFRILYRGDRIRMRVDTHRSAEDVVVTPTRPVAKRSKGRVSPSVHRQRA
jgi:DNA-binding GntR family transcriptional regulator